MATTRHLLYDTSTHRLWRQGENHLLYGELTVTDRAFVTFGIQVTRTSKSGFDSADVAQILNDEILLQHEDLRYGSDVITTSSRLCHLRSRGAQSGIWDISSGPSYYYYWVLSGSSTLVVKPASWKTGSHRVRIYVNTATSDVTSNGYLVLNDDPVHVPRATDLSGAVRFQLPSSTNGYVDVTVPRSDFQYMHVLFVPQIPTSSITKPSINVSWAYRSFGFSRFAFYS